MIWTSLVTLPSSPTHKIRYKINILNGRSQQSGVETHRGKTKRLNELRINQANYNPIFLGETSLQDVNSQTYLGSSVDNNKETDRCIKINQMTRGTFIKLRHVWKSNKI